MSDIGTLLEANGPADATRTTLDAHQFAMTAYAFMRGDLTGPQALAEYNTTLAANEQPVLTAQEQTDLTNMKTHFNGLTGAQNILEYFESLHWHTMRLQAQLITVAQWDAIIGL